MKKFLCIIILLSINLMSYAAQIDLSTLNDENLNKQLEPIIYLLDEAAKTNDLDGFYNACVKGYKLKKTGNLANIKIYNDVLSAAAIQFSAQKYDYSKDKKYLKRAYKWAKISVRNKTTQIFSIKSDILLASMFLDTKEMVRAYELYRAVDINGALSYKNDFSELYDATKKYIADRNQQKRMMWAGSLAVMGSALQSAGNAISQYERERSNYYSNYYYGY